MHCLSKFDRSVVVNCEPNSIFFLHLYDLFFALETIGLNLLPEMSLLS